VGSFQLRLAVRFIRWLVILMILFGASAFVSLRLVIYQQVDETLLRLAEIEDAATSDASDSSAHFHDNVFQPVAGRGVRYAEIWTSEGVPIARSASLAGGDLDLPADARRAGAEGRRMWFTHRDSLGAMRSIVYPLGHGATRRAGWILQVTAPLDEAHEVLSAFLKILLVIGFFGTVGGVVGTWRFAGQAMRPVREIAEQAGRLDPGRSAGTITVEGASLEHDHLVRIMNRAFDRAFHAVEIQRQLTADAGHDLRTPLAVMQGDIEVGLRRERSAREYQDLLERTLDEIRRLTRISDDLLTLARADADALPVEIAPVDIELLMATLLGRYRPEADRQGVGLEYHGAVDGTIDADEDWLRRAVGNVIENALHYTPRGGSVRVSTSSLKRDGSSVVEIVVDDDGPGVEPDDLPRLFDRFFRADRARESKDGGGTGLGLPITKAVVEAHGGIVEIVSEAGEGVRVTMTLPVRHEGRTHDHAGPEPLVPLP
jgi:signal transduction histidine kinase